MIGALALGLWSCSSDEPLAGGGDNNDGTSGDVHAKLQIALPTATRSQTNEGGGSTAGTEYGTSAENNVNNVLVVLAYNANEGVANSTPDYRYITSAESDATNITSSTVANPVYNLRFESTKLAEYLKPNEEGVVTNSDQVYVFTYCNPTTQILATFYTGDGENKQEIAIGSTFTDKILTISSGDDASIWTDNRFLMANANVPTAVTLPSYEELVTKYNTEAKAFNLGTVKVERAAVRFDFKSNNDNIYTIKDITTDENVGRVQMIGLSLINEASEFYALRRVSADGKNQNITIGGLEIGGTSANYVVSPNADLKLATGAPSDLLAKYFLQEQSVNLSARNYTLISDLSRDDDDDNWNPEAGFPTSKDGFKFWRYATENTIPGDASNQLKGYTTSVAFKAELLPLINPTTDASKALASAIEGKKVIYVFDKVMYGDRANLEKMCKDKKGNWLDTKLSRAYQAAFAGHLDDTTYDLPSTSNGIGMYRPDAQGHYYMYYIYRVRHNDNLNNQVMWPMEFSVVRNNVYKMFVSAVYDFGHPDTPDDPDPEKPDEPDETPEVRFKVNVEVLPWVVRMNNVVFE